MAWTDEVTSPADVVHYTLLGLVVVVLVEPAAWWAALVILGAQAVVGLLFWLSLERR